VRARVSMFVGEVLRRAWVAGSRVANVRSGDASARRFHSFGANSTLCFPVTLHGRGQTAIGTYTVVGPYTTLSAGQPFEPPDPDRVDPVLRIGDRCVIGRSVTITAHCEIVVEDDVWMGNHVYISDQNHGWDDAHRPIGHQAQDPLPVRIGASSWIGHGAILLPGTVLGERVVVAAGAVVTGPVPDHSIVGGIPARVIGTTASCPDRPV
jgi:carbonic anhydrase/acetyltransferase-like protein (isoleucine patch superfamily)